MKPRRASSAASRNSPPEAGGQGMKDGKGPRTVLELQARFPDEAACVEFLRKLRWPEGFVCPRCQGRASSTIRTRRLDQCRACRYQASLTAGTVLHRTRLPLRVWFWAIFFLGRHKTGISALQLQKDLGLGSYKTAWTLLHKLRGALGEPASQRLVGLVEADETYVGARGEAGTLALRQEPGGRGRGEPERSCRLAAAGPRVLGLPSRARTLRARGRRAGR